MLVELPPTSPFYAKSFFIICGFFVLMPSVSSHVNTLMSVIPTCQKEPGGLFVLAVWVWLNLLVAEFVSWSTKRLIVVLLIRSELLELLQRKGNRRYWLLFVLCRLQTLYVICSVRLTLFAIPSCLATDLAKCPMLYLLICLRELLYVKCRPSWCLLSSTGPRWLFH